MKNQNNTTTKQFIPVVSGKLYYNTDTHKALIIKENTSRAGVYCFQNLPDGLQYIGSAQCLFRKTHILPIL
jgi:hypothetical protein